jgi:hypothetical protein
VEEEGYVAERELRRCAPLMPTADDGRAVIRAMRDPVRLLRKADPDRKNELYEALGVTLRYLSQDAKLLVEVAPQACQVPER